MSKKGIYNGFVKGGVALGTILLGVILTGSTIAGNNRTAISNALNDPYYEIQNLNKNAKYFTSKYSSLAPLINDGRELAKTIESEGAVLLENNNNALPLDPAKESKVSLFGYQSWKPSTGGRGSSMGSSQQKSVDLKEGLENNGLTVNPTLYDYYSKTLKNDGFSYKYDAEDAPFHHNDDFKNTIALTEAEGVLDSISEYGDVGIYIITRTSGEASDIGLKYKSNGEISEDKLRLSDNEKDIIKGMTELKKAGKLKKIIILLNATNQIAQQDFEDPDMDIDATLWIGHTGCTGLDAVGEILTGKVTPSGHLVDTFWYDHHKNPVVANYGVYKYGNRSDYDDVLPTNNKKKADGYGTYVAYQEGIYLGYRYAETIYTDKVMGVESAQDFDYATTISAPFGSGLSYAEFKLDNFNVTKGDHEYTVKVDVTNTSDKYSGKEVVQVYVNKPYGEEEAKRNLERPAVELAGFGKTGVLAPGAKETVEIVVDEYTFTSYDANVDKTYVITEGDYQLTAAQDAHQAANNFLAKAGKSKANGMTEEGNAANVATFHLGYDKTTYAKSKATGNNVTNLFDKADINKFEGKGDNKIDFLSRDNWKQKLGVKLNLTDAMVDEIMRQQDVSSIKKDNGEYPTYGAKNDLQLIDLLKGEDGKPLPYDDPKWDKFLDQLTWEDTIELINNGLRQTNASPLLGKPVTKDHNGPTGLTQPYGQGNGLARETNDKDARTTPAHYPSVPVLGATFNIDLATAYGDMLGEDALWAGYNGFYGVGLNTHRSPYAGRHFEYWSEDPLLAGYMAAAQVKALQAHGCNAYIKHFALNDQESQRFGIQVWSNEQALREINFKPFEYAVTRGGAVAAMAAFSRVGMEFAPACHALLTDLLRGEWGMTGFVVTDMYSLGYTHEQMPQFLMAGCDIPDGEVKRSVYEQFRHGYSEVANQMRESAKRLMYATLHSNAMNGFDENTTVIEITPKWESMLNTASIVIYVVFGLTLTWGLVSIAVENKDKIKKIIKK